MAITAGPALSDARQSKSLQQCTAIDAPMDRLACYDQLAGRAAGPGVAAPMTSAATPTVAPPAKPETFGLYAAEHPAALKAASLTATIASVGNSASGRKTISLEGGELWELETDDPLIAKGDSVTIKRAALGSFLMTTPSGRTDRLHRLR